MLFDVHVFQVVRVKVIGVEAETQSEATAAAADLVTLAASGHCVEVGVRGGHQFEVENAEEVAYFMVDQPGDDNYTHSRFYNPDGSLMEAETSSQPLHRKRYLVADRWEHRFDGASAPRVVRFVFDREKQALISLDVKETPTSWAYSLPQEVQEVQQRLLAEYPDVLSNPKKHGLREVDCISRAKYR